MAIYVGFDGPLDQFYMRSPARLFQAQVEAPRIDPSNAVLLEQHVACAAAELPVVLPLDEHYFGAVCASPFTLLYATFANLSQARRSLTSLAGAHRL